eukprot:478566_1
MIACTLESQTFEFESDSDDSGSDSDTFLVSCTYGCGPPIDINAVINGAETCSSIMPKKIAKSSAKYQTDHRQKHSPKLHNRTRFNGHESDEHGEESDDEQMPVPNTNDEPAKKKLVSMMMMAQSLLTSNEEYKKQIDDLSSQNKELKAELHKSKQIADAVRHANEHLKKERDEVYVSVDQIEKRYQMRLQEERQRHQNELNKLRMVKVPYVINQWKQRSIELQENVDTLTETLTRKQQSLVQALEAMDGIVMQDEKDRSQPQLDSKTKMKQKLNQLNKRRKSFSLPKPQVRIRTRHRQTVSAVTLPQYTILQIKQRTDHKQAHDSGQYDINILP